MDEDEISRIQRAAFEQIQELEENRAREKEAREQEIHAERMSVDDFAFLREQARGDKPEILSAVNEMDLLRAKDAANTRVRRSDALRPHWYTLLEVEGIGAEEHFHRVATASEVELLEWLRSLEEEG